MSALSLGEQVADVPSLRALFVTAMPDCLLFDSWIRPSESWSAEDTASYFGDLVRANREGLKALGSWSSEMQVTIESAELLLVLRELRGDFVVTLAYERALPLGMVRLHTKRVIDRLMTSLPTLEVEQRPRGVRVMEFVDKYAPDPHAVVQRLALRTGIPLDQLRRPEGLDAAQLERLEASVKSLLGLESLAV